MAGCMLVLLCPQMRCAITGAHDGGVKVSSHSLAVRAVTVANATAEWTDVGRDVVASESSDSLYQRYEESSRRRPSRRQSFPTESFSTTVHPVPTGTYT